MATDWTLTESESASLPFELRQHETEQVLSYGYAFLKYFMRCVMYHTSNEGSTALSAEKNM